MAWSSTSFWYSSSDRPMISLYTYSLCWPSVGAGRNGGPSAVCCSLPSGPGYRWVPAAGCVIGLKKSARGQVLVGVHFLLVGQRGGGHAAGLQLAGQFRGGVAAGAARRPGR